MANEDPTARPDAPEAEPEAATGDTPPADAPETERAEQAEQPADQPTLDDAVEEATGEETPAEGAGEADGGGAAPDPVAEAQRQRDEYLDHLRRERAEFENFRRRVARERAEAQDRGAERLVSSLIGVLDNFGFVLEAAKGSSDESLAKGTQMVYAELLDVLRKAGLEEIPGVGEPFDPNWHEAMLQVEADEPVDDPVVAEVLRPGYRFKDRVLRPASVSVAQ